MNPTLKLYLDNANTLAEWAARFQMKLDRVSMIRTAAVFPMVDELKRMACAFGMDPLELESEIWEIHKKRRKAVRAKLDGRPSTFRVGRQGRAPKI